eukprot:764103-Hanusia_phi.AAC.1
MGLKWTDLAEGVTNGGFTGYLHWDNLYGDAIIPNDLKINGNVGINTTPNTTYKLDVNGSLNCTGLYLNGSAFTASDWSKNGTVVYYTGGNVSIGSNTTTYKLNVAGTLNCSSLYFNGTIFQQYITSTSGDFSVIGGQLNLNTSPSYWMTGTPPVLLPTNAIYYSGAVSVGTTATDINYSFIVGGGAANVRNNDNSKIIFGPNSSWSSYLKVGSGSSSISTNTAQYVSKCEY